MSSISSNKQKFFVEEEEDTFSLSSLSDSHPEEHRYPGESDCSSSESCSDYEAAERWQAAKREEYHQTLIKEYNIQVPDKQQWIASWLETGDYANSSVAPRKSSTLKKDGVASRASYTYQVDVYGYYKKKQRVGGYGVIFRDPGGKPVSASAWSSKGGSWLYYQLKGLRKGLRLAIAYELDNGVLVRCNSERLARIFVEVAHTSSYCRHRYKHRSPRYPQKICNECVKKKVFYDVEPSESRRLARIVKDVHKMSEGFKFNEFKSDFLFSIVTACSRRTDKEAAYFLAKHFKNKREIKPKEFPHALREIIWEDAYEGDMTYSLSSWINQFHRKSREESTG